MAVIVEAHQLDRTARTRTGCRPAATRSARSSPGPARPGRCRPPGPAAATGTSCAAPPRRGRRPPRSRRRAARRARRAGRDPLPHVRERLAARVAPGTSGDHSAGAASAGRTPPSVIPSASAPGWPSQNAQSCRPRGRPAPARGSARSAPPGHHRRVERGGLGQLPLSAAAGRAAPRPGGRRGRTAPHSPRARRRPAVPAPTTRRAGRGRSGSPPPSRPYPPAQKPAGCRGEYGSSSAPPRPRTARGRPRRSRRRGGRLGGADDRRGHRRVRAAPRPARPGPGTPRGRRRSRRPRSTIAPVARRRRACCRTRRSATAAVVASQSRVSRPRASGLHGITPMPWSTQSGSISRSSSR